MKVRTLEQHYNRHGDSWQKNVGKKYDAPDDVAERLIDRGLVEADKPKAKAKAKK